MTTIAEIVLPAREFALGETFLRAPETRFEIVGVVAHEDHRTMPQMRATAPAVGSLRSTLADDPTVTDARLLTDFGDRELFEMVWEDGVREAVSLLVKGDATVLTANAVNDEWRFRVRFADRKRLADVYESCRDADLSADVRTINERKTPRSTARKPTHRQYETLCFAAERGYYDVPRGATTEDIADELGISHQAVSERLRRGHRNLVERTLASPARDGGGNVRGR
ncbi:bacterio-opsin activator domain-containing protein [Haladaptatus salinisoli]|uniref:helix-turn-helix domain-containing protein n=1 Tax=Haladaptatus salinisoli TaxID=2884876 RepID=UPI001D0B6BA7|nr:helix-turn-helix domain-containing protein [Haladaptatus salinisoli]